MKIYYIGGIKMLELLAIIVTICIIIWTIYLIMMGRITMKFMKVYEKLMENFEDIYGIDIFNKKDNGDL